MGPIYTISDFLDMVRRRFWMIVCITFLGSVFSVLWALSIPHAYRSSEVIQIEQPQVADTLAPSTVESSAARRLQLIEQQLMARNSLVDIIERFNLYEELANEPMSVRVNILRQSISITGVAAVRQGYADDGAISVITIQVDMGTPEKARDVANALADRTRDLAAARREEQTRETLEFFRRQEQNLAEEVAALERALTEYRSQNDLSLDDNRELLQSELSSLNDAILELERDIIAARLARENIDTGARAATIARERAEIDAQLDSLTTQRTLLEDRRLQLSTSLQTTPEVERELARFDRRLSQLQGQLDVAAQRRSEAEVAYTLESNARGERLITLEDAQLPDYPYTMARKNRAAMGAVASGVIALIVAFIMELRHPVIRTAAQMERETGLRPVISIPPAPRTRVRRGLAGLWQQRREAGQRGRKARIARKSEQRG
jgi:uncharacterized protein involved in exopolysaccharide biosynthesis